MTSAVVVFLTAPSARAAARLARTLVREGLAACVSVRGGWNSVYRWEGRIERAAEHLLLAKTTRKKFPALRRRVREIHPYQVPEILALPVAAGDPPYLRWLNQ